MFASKSLIEHLARGVLGLAAFVAIVLWAPQQPWVLAALPVALIALRGCPSCWLFGLIEIVTRGGAKSRACVDGSCANRLSDTR